MHRTPLGESAATDRSQALRPAARAGAAGILALLALLCACRSSLAPTESGPAAKDPRQGPVPVQGALGGWRAELVIDTSPTGIWTVGAVHFLERYGTPEVVALDDRGRCHVLIPYSGRWTPLTGPEDGRWLGALACADVDPRQAGKELYVGGQAGNLYQVIGHAGGPLEQRLLARFPGQELHTLVAGHLDPRVEGAVLLAFTSPGGLYRLRPGAADGTFESELLIELAGRVRDALVLEEGPAGSRIALASRDGKVSLLRIDAAGLAFESLHEAPMGAGRLALAPARAGRGRVLYSTRDDGRVFRHEERAPGSWDTELVYIGPQGPRGLASGRFHADPEVESVALFGYSSEVVLLAREGGRWSAETIFVERDKGHWLAVAELDGRNGTHELLVSGFAGRVVLLSRPVGYGLAEGAARAP